MRQRTLTALFRARARLLIRSLDAKRAMAMRLLPALFHANFPWPQLKTDPPGVEAARATLAWTRLAREFDLPAPTGIQRGRRLVAALLVTQLPDQLDVHVVPAAGLSPYEEQRIAGRARAIEALLKRREVPVRITATGPSAQPYDAASRTRLIAFGALIAGRLPAAFFDAGPPTTDPLAAQLWLTAPSPLARTLSILTLEPWTAGEMAELSEVTDFARAVGQPVWRFAEPGLLSAARAALRSKKPHLPFAACALAETSSSARDTAERLARHLGPTPKTGPVGGVVSVEETLHVVRALAVELTQAVRRLPRCAEASALRARLPHQVLGGGCPQVLLPALKQALLRAARGDVPALVESWRGPAVEVRLGSGGVLGRGTNVAHAWVRALALVCHAYGTGIAPLGQPPVWRKLAPRLLQPPTKKTLWLEVDPIDQPSVPADPINRGRARELGLTQAMVVALRPRGRPSGYVLSARATTPRILEETVRGSSIAFVPGELGAQPIEARLLRVASRCRAVTERHPLAVEAGGDIFVVTPSGVERRVTQSFGRRPEHCTFDPEAPDFGAEVTRGRELRASPNQVECLVWTDDQTTARVLCADSHGYLLRDQVPLEQLETYLIEAQALLRPSPMCALSVRVAPDLVTLGYQRFEAKAPPVRLRARGELPFDVVVELDGEQFGAGSRWGWKAAASAVLSRWPPGVLGALQFDELDVWVDGVRASGLWRLYARSLIRRRLLAHIEVLARTFSFSPAVPNS